VAAWRRGDLPAFGQLVAASGLSSIENYECGAPPLIDLYHMLVAAAGVYGARFSGAGFRGCCMALVAPDAAPSLADDIRRAYARKHPDLSPAAQVLICRTGDGARVVAE
jgi:galacturonokinase